MKVRRVVTGHTAAGKATVASDSEVDAITLALMPGTEFCRAHLEADNPGMQPGESKPARWEAIPLSRVPG